MLAEPARGGYRRYLAWTVAAFPVPRDWERTRLLLAPLGRDAAAGAVADDETLDAAVLDAYGLARADVAALANWAREE